MTQAQKFEECAKKAMRIFDEEEDSTFLGAMQVAFIPRLRRAGRMQKGAERWISR